MYNFKKFEEINKRSEGRITVTGSNGFGLPTKFYRDNQIYDFKYVVLYWDQDKKVVGMHFTNDKDEKSKFSIVKSKKYGGMVSAKSFFTKNEIDAKLYKGRYDYEKHDEPGVGRLYVIRLVERNISNAALKA